jgi:hypothetical protein
MKKELDKSKASFKLDLIETANADPILSGSDLKLLVAYASVMKWPSCRTWLAASLAQAMTGLSERQFRSSRACLLGKNDFKRAYLLPATRSGEVAAYRLINPWRDEARQYVEAMTAYHREVERQKKAAQRSALSRQNLPGQNTPCPGKICRSVPAKFAAYTPKVITPKNIGREETDLGTNVLSFTNPRKAS